MSTRCQVRIIRNGYPLNYYHHCDGYFEGVGKELQEWLKECIERNEGRKNDCLDEMHVVEKMTMQNGYEPTFCIHGDIEYFYLLDFDRMVFKAYRTKGFSPWAKEGDDQYDQYKPWYDQIPNYSKMLDMIQDEMTEQDD